MEGKECFKVEGNIDFCTYQLSLFRVVDVVQLEKLRKKDY